MLKKSLEREKYTIWTVQSLKYNIVLKTTKFLCCKKNKNTIFYKSENFCYPMYNTIQALCNRPLFILNLLILNSSKHKQWAHTKSNSWMSWYVFIKYLFWVRLPPFLRDLSWTGWLSSSTIKSSSTGIATKIFDSVYCSQTHTIEKYILTYHQILSHQELHTDH